VTEASRRSPIGWLDLTDIGNVMKKVPIQRHDDDDPDVPSVLALDHRDPRVAAELVTLQRASYRVEAELIGDDSIPPLHESADAVAALDLTFLVVKDEDTGELVGAIGYAVTDGVLDIDRLVVHPKRVRGGVGRQLVAAVLNRVPHERAVVSTAQGNQPARRLYERAGFVHRADVTITPTLVVSQYERLSSAPRGLVSSRVVFGAGLLGCE
jgi:GNAT superfamily N-acetyltransferase